MPPIRAWFSRFLGLFRKNRRETEMREEMQAHIDLLTNRYPASGMSPNEAKSAALREFGGVEQLKEFARKERVWVSADEFLQDLRFGFRILLRNPGFSALV